MKLLRYARNDGITTMHLPFPLRFLPALAIAVSLPAQAAEWTAEPDISLRSGYNDNVLLSAGPHSSVWEADLFASTKFGVAKENQGLFGDAGVKVRRFTGGSGREDSDLLDREDYFFNTDAYHQTERNIFRGNIDYIRDSTLDSEVNEIGNVSNVYATRIRKTLGASWTRTLAEKMTLDLGYQYNDISFADDPGISDLIEYTNDQLTAALNYQFTPRTQGSLSSSWSQFKPETNFNSETLSLQAGVNSAFSETLDWSILAGYRNTKSDTAFLTGFCIGADPGAEFPDCTGGTAVPTGTDKGETETNGPVYSANITKSFEKASLGATFIRTTSPGLNGQLLDSNRFILDGKYRLTAMLRSSLKIEYAENETIVNLVGRAPDNVTQKFFRITPRVSWQFLREWRLAGDYRYVKSEKRITSNIATQNAFYLTLSYVPLKFSISR